MGSRAHVADVRPSPVAPARPRLRRDGRRVGCLRGLRAGHQGRARRVRRALRDPSSGLLSWAPVGHVAGAGRGWPARPVRASRGDGGSRHGISPAGARNRAGCLRPRDADGRHGIGPHRRRDERPRVRARDRASAHADEPQPCDVLLRLCRLGLRDRPRARGGAAAGRGLRDDRADHLCRRALHGDPDAREARRRGGAARLFRSRLSSGAGASC
jgi:hypothetical protein